MTDRSSWISDEWIDALSESLEVFGSLVLDCRVVEAWSEASALDGYTVGGVAGHVLSLMIGLRQRLGSPPSDVVMIPYVDWYGPALAGDVLHPGLIEVAESLAATGPPEVAANLRAAGDGLVRCLHGAKIDLLVPLASLPGVGVRLDDFLRTRFVEITVHARDLAASAGLQAPDFPATAYTLAASVIVQTIGRDAAPRLT